MSESAKPAPRGRGARLNSPNRFEVTHREVFVILDPTGDERSYSAHQITHLGTSAIGTDANEIKDWAADLRDLTRSGDYFFSLNRYIFLASKPLPQ